MASRSFRKADPRSTDQALVRRHLAGDGRAFEQIVAKHWPGVTRLAARRLGAEGAAEVEDVANEVFAALLEELPRWRGEAGLYTWLFKVTCNRCAARADFRRRRRQASAELAVRGAAAREAESAFPGSELHRQEQSRRLRQALKTLSERRRAVTILHYCHGMSPKELAGAFDVTESTIKSTLQKSLKLLRGIFRRPEKP